MSLEMKNLKSEEEMELKNTEVDEETGIDSRKGRKRSKSLKYKGPSPTATSFCQNSSMRGVPKLIKYKQIGLRLLWISFVMSMGLLLLFGAVSLTVEYLGYNTLINTREGRDGISKFPSITICNHHPFKENAQKLWESKSILSPRNFSEGLRQSMKQMFKKGNLNDVKKLFFNDRIISYFETIGSENAEKIGYDSSCILYCIIQLQNKIHVGHGDECGIEFTLFQHPKYFNCYTVNVKPELMDQTISLGIVTHVGAEPDFNKGDHVGLLQEIFSQAHGIRISVHEPHIYPDPIRHGINLEAGKFIEMKFATNKWVKLTLPSSPCLDTKNFRNNQPKYYDINNQRYNYTADLCKHVKFAHQVRDQCHCYSSLHPLPDEERLASKDYTYCSTFNSSDLDGTLKRLRCFEKLQYKNQFSDPSDPDEASDCQNRCHYYTYDVHSSNSQWVQRDWQLYWLMMLSDVWRELENKEKGSKGYEEALLELSGYLEAKSPEVLLNLTKINLNVSQNIFFVITRDNFVTTDRVETLSLTANALVSRIGGLSSLTLGVTFATFYELVEFVFLLCYKKRAEKKSRLSPPA